MTLSILMKKDVDVSTFLQFSTLTLLRGRHGWLEWLEMNWKYALCVSTLAYAASAPGAVPDGYVSYTGLARARHSTDILYGERDVLLYRQGRLAERAVLYTCSDGSAFARKIVSSYPNALVPDFLFEDASNGMREGIREDAPEAATSGARSVFYRERSGDAEKSGPLPSVPGMVADAGFDEFVQSHWDSLMTGKAVDVRFLLPSRLSDYGFQVQRLRGDLIRGTPTEVFRLRLSGVWGWFLPAIDVYYSSTDHVLMRYDGISDLHDATGNNYKATIDFPVEERKATTAQAMLEARAAPIAPCRKTQ